MKISTNNRKPFLTAFISVMTLSLVLLSPAYSADIYKTVDENGKVTYSDKITNDKSEKIETKELNTLPSVTTRTPQKAKTKSLIPTEYQITISEPANEFHVNPGQRDLTIQVSTVPNVNIKHTLQILDNGAPIEGSTITNIGRGTHVLIAIVIDEQGRTISRSKPTTVYVHRPTAKR
ncbi:MAG: DUF4124 domain-containing protein [Cellvibrionaceae bacterium]